MKIDRILLIAPSAYTFKKYRDINPLPPLGLGYLASSLVTTGVQVKILDCLALGWHKEEEINDSLIQVGLSDEEIREVVAEYRPEIVGVNCQFSRQNRIYHRTFSLVKEEFPGSIVIAGGPHVTVCPEEILSDDNCDYILMGEAEESVKDLVIALQRDEEISQIDGLGWRENGEIHINPKTAWIEDLDSIPFPAYHLMDLDIYYGVKASHGLRHRNRFMPIMTSRGCPAKCTFCSARRVWGDRYRMRSVDHVIEEMKILRYQYDVEEIMFEDDNVTANPKRAKNLFRRMIDEKLNFVWDTPNGVGVWSIDTEMLDLMKDSGCLCVNFPVESGSQRVLSDIIKKPQKLSRIEHLIDHCKKIDLDFGMFLVIGMPGETISEIWKSIKFAANCGCFHPHISVATPYPGSELFEICKEKQLFSKEFSYDDLFIRGFLIETTDWDEKILKKTLLKGRIYLMIRQLMAHPFQFLISIGKKLTSPSKAMTFLQILRRSL